MRYLYIYHMGGLYTSDRYLDFDDRLAIQAAYRGNRMEFFKENEDTIDKINAVGCPYPISTKELNCILKGK